MGTISQNDAHSVDRMVEIQAMKHALTDFFSSYRKRFVVALLAVMLCGCESLSVLGCGVGPCGPPPSLS
jgi:hypothetical protein